MGIIAYALVGFCIISLLFTQYAFAETGMEVSVNAFEGSTIISISGHSSVKNNDITIMVSKPDGNTISVSQLSPDANGDFMRDIQLNPQLMDQNGIYFVAVKQGASSLYSFIFPVEIINGYTRATSITQSTLEVTPITVSADRTSYSSGDTIRISGNVGTLIGQAVSIVIIDPIGEIVSIAQAQVGSDKRFSVEIVAGGAMNIDGTYTIKVTYGGPNTTAETTFVFGETTTQPSITISTDKSVYKENEGMYVTYVISERISNEELSIRLYDPNGDNISSTIISDAGLSYQLTSYTTFFPVDNRWDVGGVYTIIGEYADSKTILTVEVITSSEGSTTPTPVPFDNVPPLILTPSDLTLDTTYSSALVDFSVKAIDDQDGIVRPNCSRLF